MPHFLTMTSLGRDVHVMVAEYMYPGPVNVFQHSSLSLVPKLKSPNWRIASGLRLATACMNTSNRSIACGAKP